MGEAFLRCLGLTLHQDSSRPSSPRAWQDQKCGGIEVTWSWSWDRDQDQGRSTGRSVTHLGMIFICAASIIVFSVISCIVWLLFAAFGVFGFPLPQLIWFWLMFATVMTAGVLWSWEEFGSRSCCEWQRHQWCTLLWRCPVINSGLLWS